MIDDDGVTSSQRWRMVRRVATSKGLLRAASQMVPPYPSQRAVVASGLERVFSVSDNETEVVTALCEGSGNAEVAAEPVVERFVPVRVTRLGVKEESKRFERRLRNDPRVGIAAGDLLEASLKARPR